MDNLLEKYINLCIKQYEFTKIGDYKNNNKVVKQISQILENLQSENKIDLLKSLLDHEHLNVRLFAASDLIENGKSSVRIVTMLKKIKETDNGIIGFGAEMTLKRIGIDNE